MNVLLIGCGYWGKNYLRILSELDCVDNIYCSDVGIEQDVAEQLLKKYPKTKRIYGYPHGINCKLLPEPIDCVVIATPSSTHYSITKELLQLSKPVLVEKPLCLTSKEAQELRTLSQKHKAILMTGNTYLYNPAIKYIKKAIESDQLGEIRYTDSLRVHLGLVREDVNVFYDLAPHDISILLYLLGEEVLSLQVETANDFSPGNKADMAAINIKFKSGIISRICVSWSDCEKERIFKIIGSKGKIVFDDLNLQWPLKAIKNTVLIDNLFFDSSSLAQHMSKTTYGDVTLPRLKFVEPLKEQTKTFLARVKQDYKWTELDEIGVKTVEMLEMISQCQ